ncbi:hypothetical protein [Humidisolicoccus flavus]|uniref:hypothetical protein n=1 Tax=Humidisolicoccus flavus TaxID=3111414 RepID=UPI00324958AC
MSPTLPNRSRRSLVGLALAGLVTFGLAACVPAPPSINGGGTPPSASSDSETTSEPSITPSDVDVDEEETDNGDDSGSGSGGNAADSDHPIASNGQCTEEFYNAFSSGSSSGWTDGFALPDLLDGVDVLCATSFDLVSVSYAVIADQESYETFFSNLKELDPSASMFGTTILSSPEEGTLVGGTLEEMLQSVDPDNSWPDNDKLFLVMMMSLGS